MADRFPSIEDIDGGQSEAFDGAGEGSFLDRERAILGQDAEQFGSTQGPTNNATTVEDDDGDLLGGDDFGGDNRAATVGNDLNEFESSFPAIDTQNESVGPGGTITNSSAPYQPSSYTNYATATDEEESEPVRQWREKRDADLARRDEASAKKKEETVNTARTDIDSFYESYNRKTDKQKAQTAQEAEEFLKNREDTTAGGTAWERIAKLADLSGKGHVGGGKGSTKERMREILLSLKGDKDAPGAGGV